MISIYLIGIYHLGKENETTLYNFSLLILQGRIFFRKHVKTPPPPPLSLKNSPLDPEEYLAL